MNANVAIEAFRPAPWLRGRHAQTIVGRYLRIKWGIRFTRERLETPDNDFIDLDFPVVDGASISDTAPVVLLLHGLEGSAQSGYAYQAYKRLAARGIRAVGFNFRSCSGELNRGPRLYHSGDTADVARIIPWVRERYPNVPLGAMGFSLGGNVLLKYLGEQGESAQLDAAVAISVPFDLGACADAIHVGGSRLYGRHLLKKLQKKTREKAGELAAVCDVDRGLAAKTLREFDEIITAPAFGFSGADDYYAKCSAKRFLADIRKPTMILSAVDDPFLPEETLPREALAAQSYIQVVFTERGGHVGFVAGNNPFSPVFWAEAQAATYLARMLGA